MVPPQFLLDALKKSITSGTFIDTKFHVVGEASGRVGSPRALYCNSCILDNIPCLSNHVSSKGQMNNINEGFPSDTKGYHYPSDSDSKDESRPDDDLVRIGKFAHIRDVETVAFEAMLYFLYTGEIEFVPTSSDLRDKLHAQARTGDWSTGRPPSPSAKSIYRLATKYNIPTLKERAKAYIRDNLEHCDIVEEALSSFSFSFPEIQVMQISWIDSKMKEESKGGAESATKKQLWEKITTLSHSQSTHVLAALTASRKGPMRPPVAEPKLTSSTTPPFFPNWHRVKRALLKSIYTGAFIDVQFYAYNAIYNNLPLYPRALFTSSIVIGDWGPRIMTQTAGIRFQAACLADDPTDDYESLNGILPEEFPKDEMSLQYRTEAPSESREVVILMSGAWKTWMSILSYAYTNEIIFTPLRSSAHGGDAMVGAGRQRPRFCSPLSVYSLAAAHGIKTIMEDALKNIQSGLSTSNIVQELFSSFTASHQAVLDMEIEFLHEKLERDPKLLMDHIKRMGSGEAPFFPITLSLVYDKLVDKAFSKPALSSALGCSAGSQSAFSKPPFSSVLGCSAGSQSVTFPRSFQAPTPRPIIKQPGLKCARCRHTALVHDLYDGLHCPQCPEKGKNGKGERGRPFMRCVKCDTLRDGRRVFCLKSECGRRFM